MNAPTPTSRRALLGGVMLAPIVAAVACVPDAAPAATDGRSPAFIRLGAELDAVQAAEDAYRVGKYEPAQQQWLAAQEALPGQMMRVWPEPIRMLSTASAHSVSSLRGLTAKPGWDQGDVTFVENVRAFIEAADERDAALASVEAEIDAIDGRFSDLQTARFTAEDAIIKEPAVTAGDLLFKVEIFERQEQDDARASAEPLIADIRRLFGRAAA